MNNIEIKHFTDEFYEFECKHKRVYFIDTIDNFKSYLNIELNKDEIELIQDDFKEMINLEGSYLSEMGFNREEELLECIDILDNDFDVIEKTYILSKWNYAMKSFYEEDIEDSVDFLKKISMSTRNIIGMNLVSKLG